jgi:hypothetical protein
MIEQPRYSDLKTGPNVVFMIGSRLLLEGGNLDPPLDCPGIYPIHRALSSIIFLP